MVGQQNWVGGGGTGVGMIPTPKVRLVPFGAMGLEVSDYGPQFTLTQPSANSAVVVAQEVSPALLDPAVGLQLELIRYRPRTAKWNPDTSHKNASWVHPSNGTPSDGHDRRGGEHRGAYAHMMPLRTTEQLITARNQVIDVSQWMAAWCVYRPVRFIDSSSTMVESDPLPTMCGDKRGAANSRVFYSALYSPLRFKFAYSIIDPTDPAGGRIMGPTTATVRLTTKQFAFRAAPGGGQYTTYVAGSGDLLKFSFERNHAGGQ